MRSQICFQPIQVHCDVYLHSQTAPVIVFLPGIGTYSGLYSALLSGLSLQGFNVVGVDFKGHGLSGGTRGEYTVADTLSELTFITDQLQRFFSGPIGLFGYSIGSLIACAFAEQDSRVKALFCQTLLLPDVAPDWQHRLGWNWTIAMAQLLPALRIPMHQFINLEQQFADFAWPEAFHEDPLIVYDYPLSTLASLFSHKSGVLQQDYAFKAAILHGDQDEILPLRYSQTLLPQLRHPFELIIAQGKGHLLPWSDTPYLIQQAADWFQVNLPAVHLPTAPAR